MTDYTTVSKRLTDLADALDQQGYAKEANLVTACLNTCANRAILSSAHEFYMLRCAARPRKTTTAPKVVAPQASASTPTSTPAPKATPSKPTPTPGATPTPVTQTTPPIKQSVPVKKPVEQKPSSAPTTNPRPTPRPTPKSPVSPSAKDAAQALMGPKRTTMRSLLGRGKPVGVDLDEDSLPPRSWKHKAGSAAAGLGIAGLGLAGLHQLGKSHPIPSKAQGTTQDIPSITLPTPSQSTPQGTTAPQGATPNQKFITQYGEKATLALGYGYDILMRTRSFPSALKYLKGALEIGIQGTSYTPKEQEKILAQFQKLIGQQQYVKNNLMRKQPTRKK